MIKIIEAPSIEILLSSYRRPRLISNSCNLTFSLTRTAVSGT